MPDLHTTTSRRGDRSRTVDLIVGNSPLAWAEAPSGVHRVDMPLYPPGDPRNDAGAIHHPAEEQS